MKAIGNPEVMQLATKHGLPRTTLMRFLLKLMANLTDPHGGDADDRIINGPVHGWLRTPDRAAAPRMEQDLLALGLRDAEPQ